MDRLKSMRVFQAVVDEGGFAAAARRLDLDPAVVTRLVADLEQHLATPLLQRTTRRVALTPAGEAYAARLRGILAEIDEADASVSGQARELRGRLRILALPVVATHVLAPALPAFLARYPDIQIDLRSLVAGEPALEDHDLSFVGGDMPLPADVVVREVARSDMVLCAAPGYLRRHGTPRQAADLGAHRLLRQRMPGVSPEQLTLQHPSDPQPPQVVAVQPALVADDTDAALRATLEGAGISSQAQHLVAPYVASGQLRPVLAPWINGRVTLVAAYPGRRFLAARARVFLDHLAGELELTEGRARAAYRPRR